MWYYVKSGKKAGPVTDLTLRYLYNTGKISASTLVWRKGMDDWIALESAGFFKKIQRRDSSMLDNLALKTKFFRALLSSYAILSASFIFFNLKRLNYFDAVVFSDSKSSQILNCVGVEYGKISSFTSIVLFFVFLILLKTAFNWIYTVASNTAIIRKEFIVSPTYVAWSIFIPVANFVQPFQFLKYIYKYSKISSGAKYTVFDSTFILLWWFSSLFAFLVFILNNFLFPANVTSEIIWGIIIFKIYYSVMLAIALLFWIVFVGRVYKYQRNFFSR